MFSSVLPESEFYGIDSSNEILQGTPHLESNITFKQGNAHQLPFIIAVDIDDETMVFHPYAEGFSHLIRAHIQYSKQKGWIESLVGSYSTSLRIKTLKKLLSRQVIMKGLMMMFHFH